MLNRHHIFLSFLIFCFVLQSQAQNVSNVRVQQEGNDIAIYYDLDQTADIKLNAQSSNISSYVSSIEKMRVSREFLSGDVGRNVEAGKNKKILWHVLDDYQRESFKKNSFVATVTANAPYRTFVLFEGAYSFVPSQYSVGLTIGGVKRFGWYVKARSNFQFVNDYDYSFYRYLYHYNWNGPSNHYTFSGMLPYYLTGRKKSMYWVVDAGLVSRIVATNKTKLYLLTGGGYGQREVVYETVDGKWLNFENSMIGADFSIDMSLMLTIKKFALSVGSNIIIGFNSKFYSELQIGLGFALND